MDRCEPSCITVTRSLGLVERIDQIDGGGKTRRLCAEWHIQIGVPRQELCRNWRAIFRGRRVRNFADGTGIVGGTALVASVQCRKRWSLPEPVKWAWLRPRHLPCVLACGVAPCAGYKKKVGPCPPFCASAVHCRRCTVGTPRARSHHGGSGVFCHSLSGLQTRGLLLRVAS
jgi:hypothetical protein